MFAVIDAGLPVGNDGRNNYGIISVCNFHLKRSSVLSQYTRVSDDRKTARWTTYMYYDKKVSKANKSQMLLRIYSITYHNDLISLSNSEIKYQKNRLHTPLTASLDSRT